jgi:hypothetical protein
MALEVEAAPACAGLTTIWSILGRTDEARNWREYPSGKVTVVIFGEKSAEITELTAEFWSAAWALVKFIGAVWYSVPVGTAFVTAKLFKSSVASDFEKVRTCGGSELVARPLTSWAWRMDWGIAFSITPLRVYWKSAIASPFVPTDMLRESAVNAAAGATARRAMQRMQPRTAGQMFRACGIMVIREYIPVLAFNVKAFPGAKGMPERAVPHVDIGRLPHICTVHD